VTITADDASGAVRGTTTSNAAGAYTLTISGSQTDPLRIQFTSLPPGFSPSPVGPDNGSSVQFVTDANATNVNFGAGRPEDFSEANPLIATNLYQQGHFSEANKNNPALVAVPYASGGTSNPGYENPTTNRPIVVPYERLGSSFGLGWDRINRDLYNSAFFKRHAGLGPDGTGAVYRVPVPENPGPNYQPPAGTLLYADLNAIFGPNTAGVNLHDTVDEGSNSLEDDYDTDNISLAAIATRDFGGDVAAATAALQAQGIVDPTTAHLGWDAVGKTALGGLDVSDDGQFVFVMNLADRQLYRLPTSGPLDSTTIQRTSIPLTNPNSSIITDARFRSQDLRPFAVEYHQGQVYVGAVYSVETLGTVGNQASRDELLAIVYRLDPTTMTFEAVPRATFQLNYPRVQSAIGFEGAGAPPATWEPWRPNYFRTASSAERGLAHQPIFSGITFDASGNLTLGIRDRGADQTGFFNLSIPGSGTRVEGFTGGDLLRATVNTVNDLNSGWTLESNGRVANNLNPPFTGTLGDGAQNNNTGPGGAEFYYSDRFNTGHFETSMGGTMQLPGFPDAVYTNMDPADQARAGGFSWINTLAGNEEKAYQLYVTTNGNQPTNTFGKANGLGELVALVGNAPQEIGNRVWADTDADGIQDADEPGIGNVTVRLFAPDGVTLLSTAVTAPDGSYIFSAGPGTDT
ncbi:MAG: SdrD B-like domain-containing protein, partial [Gemmataceae bacterium]